MHANTHVDISNKKLNHLSHITHLKHTEVLDCSHNSIKSLGPIVHLKQLVQLNASHNDLTDTLDITPPTLIQIADLSFNHIKTLDMIPQHTFLREITLHHNLISDLSPLASCKHLIRIDLSHNKIENIPSPCPIPSTVRHLDLSHNTLTNTSALSELSQLSTLLLCGNEISDPLPLTKCTKLACLNLDDNKLESREQILEFKTLTWLRELALASNPWSDTSSPISLDQFILHTVTQLSTLNGRPVDATSKVNAHNAFGVDAKARGDIREKWIPTRTTAE